MGVDRDEEERRIKRMASNFGSNTPSHTLRDHLSSVPGGSDAYRRAQATFGSNNITPYRLSLVARRLR